MTATSVRPMTQADLDQVLTWRNHPDVRRHMFDPQEIATEDHHAWFARHEKDPLRHLMIFEIDGRPSGFVQLHERRGQGAGEWGFYAAPEAARGCGRLLGAAAIHHAFQVLGWHKLSGSTLASNERSIRMHLALGFQLEGRLREHHFDGEERLDVCNFGLLRSEWSVKEAER